jgi:TonB family protein
MRRTFIAALLLSPLFLSAAALATPPVTDDSTSTPARPVSSGVKPAHVLYAPNIAVSPFAFVPQNAEFLVHLNVDESGKPQDVQVLKSASPDLDSQVANAVRQFLFSPSTLDKQPVATDMTLTVFVQK